MTWGGIIQKPWLGWSWTHQKIWWAAFHVIYQQYTYALNLLNSCIIWYGKSNDATKKSCLPLEKLPMFDPKSQWWPDPNAFHRDVLLSVKLHIKVRVPGHNPSLGIGLVTQVLWIHSKIIGFYAVRIWSLVLHSTWCWGLSFINGTVATCFRPGTAPFRKSARKVPSSRDSWFLKCFHVHTKPLTAPKWCFQYVSRSKKNKLHGSSAKGQFSPSSGIKKFLASNEVHHCRSWRKASGSRQKTVGWSTKTGDVWVPLFKKKCGFRLICMT